MMRALAAAAAIFVWAGAPGSAHRLDEYLQATMIVLEKDRVQMHVRLTPGVAVFEFVLRSIDANADGTISVAEQRAYGERVLRDVSLTSNGEPLRLRLELTKFADIEDLKQGRGEIGLVFSAGVPRFGRSRKLIFENHHDTRIAAYLVNCLVPSDPDIRITAQKRNYEQSVYELEYVQAGVEWWHSTPIWASGATLLLLARLGLIWRRRRS